jgi:hypothetical protein
MSRNDCSARGLMIALGLGTRCEYSSGYELVQEGVDKRDKIGPVMHFIF